MGLYGRFKGNLCDLMGLLIIAVWEFINVILYTNGLWGILMGFQPCNHIYIYMCIYIYIVTDTSFFQWSNGDITNNSLSPTVAIYGGLWEATV
jgi:hypothetical protein